MMTMEFKSREIIAFNIYSRLAAKGYEDREEIRGYIMTTRLENCR